MDEREKLKNLKDLEYNKVLNHQNVFLVLIGTSMLTILVQDSLPSDLNKGSLFMALILILILVIEHYNNKLNKIIDEIKEI